VKSGTKPAHFPDTSQPEVAFAGRSNSGKSSLINRLVNRKDLVKVSNTPGRTQLLNWFEVNKRLLLCDLPGYGYARVPGAIRADWGPMIETYLRSRETLQALVLITDVRRGFEEDDRMLMEAAAGYGLHIILVASKVDRFSKNELYNRQHAIAREMSLDATRDVVWFSAKSGAGRDDLWTRIDGLLPDVSER
jgi:GTP-binding protein